MIDTKALRNKVLDLAIQGKLTEQLESDGTAEDLFAQIQEEKQRLIKEGKIKKEKPLPPVADEEIPFEIPSSWKWVRFANIVNFHLGKTPARGDSSYWNNGLYNWITISDMPNAGHISTTNEKISQKAVDDCFNCGITKASSLIMSFKLSIGKVAILDFDAYHNEAIITITPYIDKHFVFRDFLFLILPFVSQITESHGAIKGETLNKTSLSNMVLPLPPLAEQKRIVERVEEIFKLLDIIDEAQAKYSADAETLKSKLITMGIQGKLTEQLERDGTAEELFAQIQEEKQRLIKEGKIKKEKPLPPVADEEIPFEIPSSWKWVHMGELFQHNTGKALNSSNTDGKMLEYITTSNVYWDKFDLKVIKQMPFSETEIEKCTITKGDLLICEGGDIGRSAIWNFDYDMRIQNHLHRLRAYLPDISQKFYYYIMKLYKEIGLIDGRGIGLQGFSSTRVHNLVVPLPPLAEQKRIADKLDEILRVIG